MKWPAAGGRARSAHERRCARVLRCPARLLNLVVRRQSSMTRCPQCEQFLDLGPVWGLVSLDRLGCPDRPIAIECPACFTPLRVATFRSATAVIGSYMASAAFAVVNARQATHALLALIGVGPFLLVFVYTAKIARRFATLVPVGNSDNVEFPIESFQEQLRLDAIENSSDKPAADQRTAWNCTKCGESSGALHCRNLAGEVPNADHPA
jgi:hypothetical protein